jgi:hypothetical protein
MIIVITIIIHVPCLLTYLGVVYIMDHEVVMFQRALTHGPIFMGWFLNNFAFFEVFGPLAGCKSNVDQEK